MVYKPSHRSHQSPLVSARVPGDHRHGGGAGGVREELQAYRFLENMWDIYGLWNIYMENIWNIWNIYGKYMENIWKIYGKLVGGLEHLDYFSIIYEIIIPTGFHIVQRG